MLWAKKKNSKSKFKNYAEGVGLDVFRNTWSQLEALPHPFFNWPIHLDYKVREQLTCMMLTHGPLEFFIKC